MALRVDWSYEEVVLACDLVVANGWSALDRRRDDRVRELSELLRKMSPVDAEAEPKFRNTEGVGRKTNDIATAHPDYPGVQTKGGRITREVVAAFIEQPQAMHQLALGIRAVALDPKPAPPSTDVNLDMTAEEGAPFERRVLVRERDRAIRAEKIKATRKALGAVRCEACTFDFEATYGERGRDFAEVHHHNPLSVAGPSKTSLADLAVLCSNCHRMIHRRRPWLTVDQLQAALDSPADYS